MKKCTKCGEEKELNLFYKCFAAKDGYKTLCKQCCDNKKKEYQIKNPNLAKELAKKYYYKNREYMLSKNKKYLKTKDSGLYSKYYAMISRCKNGYSYLNKNIQVEWSSYKEFKDDMFDAFLIHLKIFGARNTTLERVNNDGNYCKENCVWATYQQQNKNRDFSNFK